MGIFGWSFKRSGELPPEAIESTVIEEPIQVEGSGRGRSKEKVYREAEEAARQADLEAEKQYKEDVAKGDCDYILMDRGGF